MSERRTILEPEFVTLMPETLVDGKLYISREYGTAIHNCCCGCGNKTVTPTSGHEAWKLTVLDGTVSLTPSIGNWQFQCRSHYWIRSNKIIWCD